MHANYPFYAHDGIWFHDIWLIFLSRQRLEFLIKCYLGFWFRLSRLQIKLVLSLKLIYFIDCSFCFFSVLIWIIKIFIFFFFIFNYFLKVLVLCHFNFFFFRFELWRFLFGTFLGLRIVWSPCLFFVLFLLKLTLGYVLSKFFRKSFPSICSIPVLIFGHFELHFLR